MIFRIIAGCGKIGTYVPRNVINLRRGAFTFTFINLLIYTQMLWHLFSDLHIERSKVEGPKYEN